MGCIITKTGSNANLKGKIRAMLMKAKKEDSADAKIAFIKRRIKEIRDELDITDPESLEVFADLVTEMTSKSPNIYKEVFENGGLDPLFVLTAKGDNVETVTEDSYKCFWGVVNSSVSSRFSHRFVYQCCSVEME